MKWIKIKPEETKKNERRLKGRRLLIKYGDLYLTGMFVLGKFYYYDVASGLVQLVFQKEVTHVSIINAPWLYERRNLQTNRKDSDGATE